VVVRVQVSLWRRTVARLVRLLARLRHGYDVPFVDAIVRRHGWRAACRRLRALGSISARLEQRFGERDGHLLLAFSAVWHHCLFCAVGHLRAANLAHFHLTGELSAFDEALLPELVGGRDDTARERFSALCRGDELGSVRDLLSRQRSLCDGSHAPGGEEDELLCSSLDAYDGSDHGAPSSASQEVIPPLSHRVRDLDLRGRYEQARRRERLASGPLPHAAKSMA
jgi:hypothetical protein